jgi:hypothetical protein
MTQLEEKLNNLSRKVINEGIEDYIPDGIKNAWKSAYAVGRAALKPEIEGWSKNFPTIATTGLFKSIDKGLQRGAPAGAALGAGGGASLAGGLAAGGIINRPIQAFKHSLLNTTAGGRGSVKTRLARALGASAMSLFGSGARTAAAAGLGAGAGGVLGWQGGREAGAALAGAGALGGPAGFLVGPKSGAALAALGALGASSFAKSMDKNRRELTQGGWGGFADKRA